MSNQKKPRFGKHRGVSRQKRTMQKGLNERHDFPLHDEARPQIDQYGVAKLEAPEVEPVEVIKEVPAMHTGLPGGLHPGVKVEVGTAFIHSDRSVGIRYHDDAPLWAMEEIQSFADKVGYSLETGGPSDGTA